MRSQNRGSGDNGTQKIGREITIGRTIGCSMSVPPLTVAFPFIPPEGVLRRASIPAPTTIELALRHAPRCPVCTHGARMWLVQSKLAWLCRWGHLVYDEDMELLPEPTS